MKIHITEKFMVPAGGGDGEMEVGNRKRTVEYPCLPPKGSTFVFASGHELIIPDDTEIMVFFDGTANYDIKCRDIQYSRDGNFYHNAHDALQALKDQQPNWDYTLLGS